MRHKLALWLGLALLLVALPAQAQSRTVYWERWDVEITDVDTTTNRFTVRELYDIDFTGAFSFGSVELPYENVEQYDNVRVYEGSTQLRASCGEQRGTFCARTVGDNLSIVYYFTQPVNNASRSFTIEYDVVGALRVYPDADQLWWNAIPSEHFGFTIENATVTVQLPQGYAPREGVDNVVTYGVPGEVTVNGTRVVATATRPITGNEYFSIRLSYPHNPNARVASWQASYDRNATLGPIVNIGAILLSLAIGIGGSLWVFTRYQTRGRDPKIAAVPSFLTELPSQLPPAVVGTLVDETADLRDIMSTIVDLSRRGYLVIEETRESGLFGIGYTSSFTFKRTDKPDTDLRPYEQFMLRQIFNMGDERPLDTMRNTFYTVIPSLQANVYEELLQEELFVANPNTVRQRWSGGGVLLFILGIVGAFALGAFVASESQFQALILLPISAGFVGIVMLFFARAMPARTQRGAEETAKWRAFQEYLRNLERYSDVQESRGIFDQFLPYAVAFGLERTWVDKFKPLDNVPVPTWYWPVYLGGPWGRGYRAGSPPPSSGSFGLSGELARAGDGGFSLDNMSGGLASGLESMSNGLTNMLNTASSVMTSQPQSSGSWSSGGGGFSGGGGGGGGGGSRGFG